MPAGPKRAVPRAIDALMDALYGTVASQDAPTRCARCSSSLGSMIPEAIREKINAYLSEGPVALILDKVVLVRDVSCRDAYAAGGDAHSRAEEWAGAAARLLDAYAGHPILLVVRALGEAWRTDGSREEFARTV